MLWQNNGVKIVKVFIFGYYGFKNTGDDAMGLAISKEIKKRFFEVISYHRGDGLWKTIKNFLWADTVVIGGGSHLRNWGKKWWYCSSRVLLLGILCRFLFKGFSMVDVGSGGKRLDWIAERIAHALTIRDKKYMDSALLLNFNPRPKKKILGINLQSMSSIYYDDYALDDRVMKSVCKSINEWKVTHPDWDVRFISFNAHNYFPDDEICFKASQLVEGSKVYSYNPDVIQVIEEMSELSAFAGMRYHSLVFAYMTNTPFVAIQTYPRCKNFNLAINNLIEPIDFHGILEGKLTLALIQICHSKLDDYWLPLGKARQMAWRGIDV